jgi:hypothetical protein
LDEELGVKVNELKFIGKKLYHDNIASVWSYMYLIELNDDTEFNFSDGEVSRVEWLTKDEILSMIDKSENITPDGKDCFLFLVNNKHI